MKRIFSQIPILSLMMMGVLYQPVKAQTPIALTASSFNFDCVVENTPAANFITAIMPYGDCLYADGTPGTIAGTGMPSTNMVTDGSTTFNLRPYDASNSLEIGDSLGASGTLSLIIPFRASQFQLLATSVGGSVNMNVEVTFSDNTTEQVGNNVTIQDWFNGSPSAYILNGRYYVSGGYPYNVNSGNPRLYSYNFVISPANQSKFISSIAITRTTASDGSKSYFFALSGGYTPPNCNTFNIDNLPHGTVVNNYFQGMTVSVTPGSGGTSDAVIYDSDGNWGS